MKMDAVRMPAWSRFPWLRHGFSTRAGGVSTVYGDPDGCLNLGFTREDAAAAVERNRELFLADVGVQRPLATVRQVHGAAVRVVQATARPGESVTEADALVTALAGAPLGILTADCVPVLLADTRQRIVGAVHAGWRGTAAGVAGQAVQAMSRQFGSLPRDFVAAIGPSVGPCCYRVGEELTHAFGDPEIFARRRSYDGSDALYLDLWEANRRELLRAGVPPEAVSLVGECTACTRVARQRKYFSYRAENGCTGRMMAVIAIAD